MKTFVLVLYLLGSGIYSERFSTLEDCHDSIIEAQLIKGNDVWSAMCLGSDDEIYAALGEVKK